MLCRRAPLPTTPSAPPAAVASPVMSASVAPAPQAAAAPPVPHHISPLIYVLCSLHLRRRPVCSPRRNVWPLRSSPALSLEARPPRRPFNAPQQSRRAPARRPFLAPLPPLSRPPQLSLIRPLSLIRSPSHPHPHPHPRRVVRQTRFSSGSKTSHRRCLLRALLLLLPRNAHPPLPSSTTFPSLTSPLLPLPPSLLLLPHRAMRPRPPLTSSPQAHLPRRVT